MKPESRLKLLVRMMNKWVDLPGMTRAIVCQSIVEAVDNTGMKKVLENDGITFNTGGDDILHDMRVNAQKIFRWLGVYDEVHAFPDRLFFVEPVIVAAMPDDLKTEYLNSVYAMSGVMVCSSSDAESKEGQGLRLLRSLTKEQGEAQVALMDFVSSGSPDDAEAAEKELSEAVAIGSAALDSLRHRLKVCK